MRIAIVGGGGFRVPLIHAAIRRSRLPVDEIVLIDVNADRLRVIETVLGDPRVATTTDPEAGLDSVDLVFCAIRVGGNDGRVRDERLALDLGLIGQETVGAGGLSYALRSVPVVTDLARAIAVRAPRAWVISMTNPAGIVVEAMATELGDRVIGVCDSPVGLIRRAATATGLAGRDTTDLDVDYIGLNHLGWLRRLADPGGADALPALLHDPDRLARFEEGQLFGADLLAALGCLPNEYLYYFYGAQEALAGVRGAAHTRGEQVRADQAAFFAAARAEPGRAPQLWTAANYARNRSYLAELRSAGAERDDVDIVHGGYESVAVAAAAALTGHGPTRLILNVPNATTIPGLAATAVIETVCTVDSHGARPVLGAPLTPHQLGLMSVVKAAEQDVIAAALSGSIALAQRAFVTHPLVGSLAAARTLAQSWGHSSRQHPGL